MAYYSSKLWGKKRVLNMEAFIAPANFDPASQPLNIVSVFGDYDNVNKAYIYSFTSAIATLTLPASAGITYRWGETISGVDYVNDVVSGTAFTAGSTKRYVIVNSTATSLYANISSGVGFKGAVWLYCSSKVYGIYAIGSSYLKYVHCEDLNSVTTIRNSAFDNCTNLTGTLTIPNSVTIIGQSAFYGCTGLTGSLTIPNSVTSIGNYAFVNIPFTHLISNSSFFEVYDEVLYTTTGTITAIYSAKGYSGTLTLKSNVVIIGSNCFVYNNLRTGTLTIPNTVTTIGDGAFQNCANLTGSLTIPNSVTTIGNQAFPGCTGLTGSLTIPNSVTTIGNYAFYGCSGLTGTLTISSSVTTIGSNAFVNIPFTHLISNSSFFEVYDEVLYTTTGTITAIYSAKGYSGTLTLKSNVVIIGSNCFANNNLRTGTLTIPNTVTTIGIAAFQSCTNLTGTLTIPNSVTIIGNNAFYGCTGLTGTLTIPSSVTSIGNSAFDGCPNLTGTLTIPNSVTTIGQSAFYGCSKLNGIATIGSGITTIGNYVFYSIPLVTEWRILSTVAPAVQAQTWGNYAKPLHVKIGATGYNVAPFTNTAIFSSIIYDL